MPTSRVALFFRMTLTVFAGTILSTGCVTVPAQQPPPRTVDIQTVAARPLPRETHAPTVSDDIFDTCTDQMQDIEGALLAYYGLNHHLPESLDKLKQIKGLGQGLNFTCPTVNQPYIYVSQGLTTPGDDRVLVLYDAQPHPDGKRRAILMRLPIGVQSNTPYAKVLNLPEAVIRTYVNPVLPAAR